jgi:cytoskeletal protein CcmA (bactofilin family)
MAFGKKKQPPIRSLIGEGTVVQGELRFSEGLRIDGEVLGDVIATGEHTMLVISENARVQGKVKAGHVIINGTVVGPLESYELHQGATIDGELRPLKGVEKPALKLLAANAS